MCLPYRLNLLALPAESGLSTLLTLDMFGERRSNEAGGKMTLAEAKRTACHEASCFGIDFAGFAHLDEYYSRQLMRLSSKDDASVITGGFDVLLGGSSTSSRSGAGADK